MDRHIHPGLITWLTRWLVIWIAILTVQALLTFSRLSHISGSHYYFLDWVIAWEVTNTFWTVSQVNIVSAYLCRDTWMNLMTPEHFNQLTCTKCYVQVFHFESKGLMVTPDFFQQGSHIWPPTWPYFLYSVANPNMTYLPDALEPRSIVCENFLSLEECRKWKACCSAARSCCQSMQRNVSGDGQRCPATWDGISCWPHSPTNQRAQQACPPYYVSPMTKWLKPTASRFCTSEGQWELHPGIDVSFAERTNFDNCFDTSRNAEILTIGLYIDFIGNGISIVSLVIAICLVFCTRTLRRDLASRDSLKLHVSLFVAVLGSDIVTIPFHYVYYDAVIKANDVDNVQPAIYLSNPVWCRVLNVLSKYFRTAIYMCMFCEGLFLFRRISRMMYVNLRDPLTKYMLISWVTPVVLCVAYIITRLATGKDTRCWIDDGFQYIDYIIIAPNILALVCNFVFLLSIEYSLCTKMRTDSSDRRVQVLRHALRATFSLIPVFGVQFLFIIYRPPYWPPYEIINSVFNSAQGFLVVILYCFATNEMRQEFVICWRHCRGHRDHHLRRGSTNPNLTTPLRPLTSTKPKRTSKIISLCRFTHPRSRPSHHVSSGHSRWRQARGSLPDLVLREPSGRKFSRASVFTRTTVCSLDSSYSDASLHGVINSSNEQLDSGSDISDPRSHYYINVGRVKVRDSRDESELALMNSHEKNVKEKSSGQKVHGNTDVYHSSDGIPASDEVKRVSNNAIIGGHRRHSSWDNSNLREGRCIKVGRNLTRVIHEDGGDPTDAWGEENTSRN